MPSLIKPVLFVAALLIPMTAIAQPEERVPRLNPDAPTSAYVNGLWYEAGDDGPRFAPGERFSIGGVFTAQRPARLDTTIDLGGAYVVPPFGEAHNHNIDSPWTQGIAARYLSQGIFYHKNPNNIASAAAQGKAQALFNKPDGLDVIFAHGGLSVEEGHPERLYRRLAPNYGLSPDSLDGHAFFDMATTDVLEARWPEVLAGEPDFIKLYLLDAAQEGERGLSGLSPDVFRRAVALTKEAGLQAIVHIETAADLALAVDAGADEAAHLPGYYWSGGLKADAYRIADDLARRMAEQGFGVITTTVVTEGISATRSEVAAMKDAIQALQVENLRRLHKAGVRLLIGSDSYMQTARDEALHLHALGAFDDATLLRLWVETAPASIFPRRAIGRLVPGYEASFLALPCDPTADFACVEQVGLRVKQGSALPAEGDS